MSATIVSHIYEDPIFGDNSFKSNLSKQVIKRDLEKKAVGSPVLNSCSIPASMLRRNSSSSNNSTTRHTPLSPKFSLGLNILAGSTSSSSSSSCSSSSSSSSDSSISNDHKKLDRSMSEPIDRCQKGGTGQANSSRYKTELCRPFEENGTCKYGDKCQFAHGGHELRNLARHPKYKTELCRTFHTIGFCPYGPRCHFIHNPDESRKSSPSPPVSAATSSSASVPASQSNPVVAPQTSSAAVTVVSSTQQQQLRQPARPKALSVGSFNSLGSTGDASPPSSLSESPTSFGSFFADEHNVFSPSPTTTPSAAQNAFSFSHDFASLVSATNGQGYGKCENGKLLLASSLDAFNNNSNSQKNLALGDLDNQLYESLMRFSGIEQALNGHGLQQSSPSPIIDTLVSDVDNLSLNNNKNMSCGEMNRCGGLGFNFPLFNRIACGDE